MLLGYGLITTRCSEEKSLKQNVYCICFIGCCVAIKRQEQNTTQAHSAFVKRKNYGNRISIFNGCPNSETTLKNLQRLVEEKYENKLKIKMVEVPTPELAE